MRASADDVSDCKKGSTRLQMEVFLLRILFVKYIKHATRLFVVFIHHRTKSEQSRGGWMIGIEREEIVCGNLCLGETTVGNETTHPRLVACATIRIGIERLLKLSERLGS